MRKISLCAVAAAVILTGAFGVWTVSSTDTQARIAASSRIDPMQMMSGANNLASKHYTDYSVVFN